MLLKNHGSWCPDSSSTPNSGPRTLAPAVIAASGMTIKDHKLHQQLFSYNVTKTLHSCSTSDNFNFLIRCHCSHCLKNQPVVSTSRVLHVKQTVDLITWTLIYTWSATTINYTDKKKASSLLQRKPSEAVTTITRITHKDLHMKRNIHFYWTKGLRKPDTALSNSSC